MKILDKIWNFGVLKFKKVKVGRGSLINGKFYVHGRKNGVEIGRNCVINSNESIIPSSGFGHTHFLVGNSGRIRIGNNVGISNANIVAWDSIEIEDYVMIGSGVKIWDTDFHSIEYYERIHEDKKTVVKPIQLSEGCFIGACSLILKGVTIGRHAVVGAGSVVTKSIPDNEIWAGNPAHFIKRTIVADEFVNEDRHLY